MTYPVLTRCPVCHEPMQVTGLHCRHCDTTVEGHFGMGRLFELTAEQLGFVELFVRCEGKINRVGEELGISYPTVRSRLEEVIQALGYEVREEPPLTRDDRRLILQRLAAGEIEPEAAIRLLQEGWS